MVKSTIIVIEYIILWWYRKVEYLCIDLSSMLTRIGNWCKRKRWEIKDEN
jgi:hypothetical protein